MASKTSSSSRRIKKLESEISGLHSTLATILSELASLKVAKSPSPTIVRPPHELAETESPAPAVVFCHSPSELFGPRSPISEYANASPSRAMATPPRLGRISVPVSPPHPSQTPPLPRAIGVPSGSPVPQLVPLFGLHSPSYPPVYVNTALHSPPTFISPHHSPYNVQPSTESATIPSPIRPRPRPRTKPTRTKSMWNSSDAPTIEVTYGGGMTFEEASSRSAPEHVELPDVEQDSNAIPTEREENMHPIRVDNVDNGSVTEAPIVPIIDPRPSSAKPHSPPPTAMVLNLDYDDDDIFIPRFDQTLRDTAGPSVEPSVMIIPPIPEVPSRNRDEGAGAGPGPSRRRSSASPSRRRRSRARLGAWGSEALVNDSGSEYNAPPSYLPQRPHYPPTNLFPINVPSVLDPPSHAPLWNRYSADIPGPGVGANFAPTTSSQAPGPPFFAPTSNLYLPAGWNPSATRTPESSRLRRPRTRSRPTMNVPDTTPTSAAPRPTTWTDYPRPMWGSSGAESQLRYPSQPPSVPHHEPPFSFSGSRRRRVPFSGSVAPPVLTSTTPFSTVPARAARPSTLNYNYTPSRWA